MLAMFHRSALFFSFMFIMWSVLARADSTSSFLAVEPDAIVSVVEYIGGVVFDQSGNLPVLPPGTGSTSFSFIRGIAGINQYIGLQQAVQHFYRRFNLSCTVGDTVKLIPPTNISAPALWVNTELGIFLPNNYMAGDDLSGVAAFEGYNLGEMNLQEGACIYAFDADGDGSMDASIQWLVRRVSSAPSASPFSFSDVPSSSTQSASSSPSEMPSQRTTIASLVDQELETTTSSSAKLMATPSRAQTVCSSPE